MNAESRPALLSRMAPALTLMVMAPFMAEALQGSTRPSVYLNFPAIIALELAVWGGAAVFMRFLTRRLQLGPLNFLLLALALGFAEEFLIQQTSIAPVVIQVKGVEYARTFGVNYVYLVWALAYEGVFVVLIPSMFAELLFPKRRNEGWLNRTGLVFLALAFPMGAFGAWFTWTQIARTHVFNLPPYSPPLHLILVGVSAVALMFLLAVGPFRGVLARLPKPFSPPWPWVFGMLGFLFALFVQLLAAFAFGAAPQISPAVPLSAAAVVFSAAIFLMPRWMAHARWTDMHCYWLVFGATAGNMLGGYLGYLSATPIDFWGKTILNVLAIVVFIAVGLHLRKRGGSTAAGLAAQAAS